MSPADVSSGPPARVSARQTDTGPKAAATDSRAPSGFPDLLSKMATAGNRPAAQPAPSIAGHRPSWGKEMARVAGTLDESGNASDPNLATLLLGGDSASAADTEEQPSASQLLSAMRGDLG